MMKRNVFLVTLICAFATCVSDAAVVPRNSRASIARMPTLSAQSAKTNNTIAQTDEVIEQESEVVDTPVVENKSSLFDETVGEAITSNSDLGANELAEQIRAQRAALDAADNLSATTAAANAARASGRNACDTGLRSCMTEKCGNNFIKCASDTDTTFGTKLDSCRRNLKCNANEFKLFSAEIKSDRDAAIQLKSFNDIIDCGQTYDTCIVDVCGTKYSKCLGKSAGDNAIAKCESIAKKCTEMDSGLANRTMGVFATLRGTAEKQIATDEKQLYALRDQMKSICSRLGAMFDERSLDCVYTVNFYAGNDSTLYASKKAYAGGSFDCTPNWFGVDVTTFKENAYRLTREQTSASSAMLGSGVGMAVGAVTSGAIDRAIESHKAERAVDQAKCEKDGGTWNKFLGKCRDADEAKKTRADGATPEKETKVETETSEPEELGKTFAEKTDNGPQGLTEADLSTPETAKKTYIHAKAQTELNKKNEESGKALVSQAGKKAGQLMTPEQMSEKRAAAKAAASSGSSSSGSSSSGGSSSSSSGSSSSGSSSSSSSGGSSSSSGSSSSGSSSSGSSGSSSSGGSSSDGGK